jgi:hypothetical protein
MKMLVPLSRVPMINGHKSSSTSSNGLNENVQDRRRLKKLLTMRAASSSSGSELFINQRTSSSSQKLEKYAVAFLQKLEPMLHKISSKFVKPLCSTIKRVSHLLVGSGTELTIQEKIALEFIAMEVNIHTHHIIK